MVLCKRLPLPIQFAWCAEAPVVAFRLMGKERVVLKAHQGAALAVAFAPGEGQLLSAGQDRAVRLWDPESLEKTGEYDGHSSAVHTLTFDASGRYLASGSANAVRIWEYPGGELKKELPGESMVAFGPTDHHLGTIASPSQTANKPVFGEAASGAQVTLWDARDLSVLRRFEQVDRRHQSLAFAPNGAVLFIGGSGPIHRVSLPEGTLEGIQLGHQIGVSHIVCSPKGSVLASTGTDGTLYFWTVVGGDQVHNISMDVPSGPGGFPLAFDPKGRTVAVGCGSQTRLYNAPGGFLRKTFVTEAEIHDVAISPDGRWVANACGDGDVRIFELS